MKHLGLRTRNGNWHYRIRHQGKEWTGDTGLAATQRNVSEALSKRDEKRLALKRGQGDKLDVKAKKFNEAADEFLEWAKGERKASTALRLATSFVSLKQFFGTEPVHSITANLIEKYKTWRRGEHKVKEITLRHDLHALSPFFKYAINANWCRENPVKQVTMPSGKDATRDHVITQAEEKAYFLTALSKFELEKKGGKKSKHGPFPALHDVARIMLDQGMRPEEVMSLRVEHIDYGKGRLKIIDGKSNAARRILTMSAEVKDILLIRTLGRTNGWVFQGKNGEHLTKLNNAHNAVVKKIGAAFVLYEFRHTFATRAAERGMPLASLASILGHADLRSITKYVHVQQEAKDRDLTAYHQQKQEVASVMRAS